jgi:TetR/AcrR family transcriptional regulator, hemagglutinin/protease regulatory protein
VSHQQLALEMLRIYQQPLTETSTAHSVFSMPSRANPRRRRARPLDQQERKALLLEAAIRVFARRGLGGARHTEIAREAKVSVPAVFFYFPTREVLVREVLEEVSRFFESMIEAVTSVERSAPEIIMERLRTWTEAVTRYPEHTCVILEWSTAIRSEAWPLYLKHYERVLARNRETIRNWRVAIGSDRVDDSENDARVIAATGYVLSQMKMTRVPMDKIERFMQTVVRDTVGVDETVRDSRHRASPKQPQRLGSQTQAGVAIPSPIFTPREKIHGSSSSSDALRMARGRSPGAP